MADVKTTQLEVSFVDSASGSASGRLVLEERAEDNKKPSELAAELEAATQQAAGCDYGAVTPDPAVEAARKAALCAEDALAWPSRILRLYPSGLATVKSSLGTILNLGVRAETVTENVQFTGGAEATMKYPADSASLGTGIFFDATGTQIYPVFTYLGSGEIQASVECYGLLPASYIADYRELRLTVAPTGDDFEVLVVAYKDGLIANTVVQYAVETCDGGIAAGLTCTPPNDEGGYWPPADPTTNNLYPPQHAIVGFNHPAEAQVGEPFEVSITVKNTNNVAGDGYARFNIDIGGLAGTVTQPFTCAANGTQAVKFSAVATSEGFFITYARLNDDNFTDVTKFLRVDDPANPTNTVEWTEYDRTMSSVEVGTAPNTVTIQRIDDVTFQKPSGSLIKLIFDNAIYDL